MMTNNRFYAANAARQTKAIDQYSIDTVESVQHQHPNDPSVPEEQFERPVAEQNESDIPKDPFMSNSIEAVDWPDPIPLINVTAPETYPLEALPNTIRGAIEEVIGYVQVPVALAASCALSSLSLACQAHIDVCRDENLRGPVSLFFLTVANSGERKSSCDSFFSKPLKDYEAEQREDFKPELKEYAAKLKTWEAECGGILSAIKRESGAKKPNHDQAKRLKAELIEMEMAKPERPRVPNLLSDDSTPEDLGWRLANEWPSAGVIVSEAGIVFGSHGMGKDNVMRNLASLNIYWDGGDKKVGRRTTDSYHVKGARVTMSLMTQEETLRAFMGNSGPLARGTGFLARFLLAWPESTQGTRLYREPPQGMPRVAEFNQRITEILHRQVQMEDGGLLTLGFPLAPDAKAEWVIFHDSIEQELGASGDYYDIRDVAAKIADNAARLAALFHLFEHAGNGPVCVDCMERAALIVHWHLHEARRFFGELAVPVAVADALRLERWFIAYCREKNTDQISTREAIRRGPIRERSRFKQALIELGNTRIKVRSLGRQKLLYINPRLLDRAV